MKNGNSVTIDFVRFSTFLFIVHKIIIDKVSCRFSKIDRSKITIPRSLNTIFRDSRSRQSKIKPRAQIAAIKLTCNDRRKHLLVRKKSKQTQSRKHSTAEEAAPLGFQASLKTFPRQTSALHKSRSCRNIHSSTTTYTDSSGASRILPKTWTL